MSLLRTWARQGAALVGMGALVLLLSPLLAQGMLHTPLEDRVLAHAQAQTLTTTVKTLRDERDRQRNTLQALQGEADALQAQVAATQSELERLMAKGDSGPLAGEGLSITIADAPPDLVRNAGDTADVNWFLVHDRDILRVLNVLKSAGAQGISINGVRVTSTMAVHCGGPAIYVRDIPLVPPFKVLAVGDADTMEWALTGHDGQSAAEVYQEMIAMGLVFRIERSDAIELPAAASTQAIERAAHADK